MRRAITAALTLRFCSHTCSYVSSGNAGPLSAWHITQWSSRMRTISRSKRTVVFTVSCVDADRDRQTAAVSAAAHPIIARGRGRLVRSDHIEGERERMQTVVPQKLRPRAVAARLRHQAFERHVRTA